MIRPLAKHRRRAAHAASLARAAGTSPGTSRVHSGRPPLGTNPSEFQIVDFRLQIGRCSVRLQPTRRRQTLSGRKWTAPYRQRRIPGDDHSLAKIGFGAISISALEHDQNTPGSRHSNRIGRSPGRRSRRDSSRMPSVSDHLVIPLKFIGSSRRDALTHSRITSHRGSGDLETSLVLE
jgi:hypothetical protein